MLEGRSQSVIPVVLDYDWVDMTPRFRRYVAHDGTWLLAGTFGTLHAIGLRGVITVYRHRRQDGDPLGRVLDLIACNFCGPTGVCLITFVAAQDGLPGPDIWSWIIDRYFETFPCSAHHRAQCYIDDATHGISPYLTDLGWMLPHGGFGRRMLQL